MTSRHKHRRRRHRRRAALVALGASTIVVLPIAVVLVAAFRDVAAARSGLEAARSNLAGVERADLIETAAGRTVLIGHLDVAATAVTGARRRLVRSRPLNLLGALPYGGRVRTQLVDLASDAERATAAARDLVTSVDAKVAGAQVRNGQLPMAALADLQASAERAHASLATVVRGTGGGWTPVTSRRRQFDRVVSSLAERLGGMSDGLRTTVSFFGATGDRRYLLALGNNAEMRDGGTILSYGVLDVTGGRFNLAHTGSIAELTLDAPASTELPGGTTAAFGALHPTQTWQSVNATADFALSGRAMADMYQQATGQHVDGVIGADVPALAALLSVVGPVTAPGFAEPVTAENAGRILLHDQYDGIPPLIDGSNRRDRLSEVTRGVFDRLRTSTNDPIVLGRALARAAAGRHLQLWSTIRDEERFFEASGLGGGPAGVDADRTFHVAVQNRTATKLDYFVQPTVTQAVRLTKKGDAVVSTSVRLENRAPKGAAPSYQLGPDGFTSAPGDYVAWVVVWGPSGGDGDGEPSVAESGLRLSERVALVRAGETVDVTFAPTTVKGAVRNGKLNLRLVPQARLDPAQLHMTVAGDGWRVSGPTEWRGAWDRTLSLSWKVQR